MKNLFTSIALFIVASILLSSCGHENLSLTKRHYRNGYYVERSSKPSNNKAKEQEPVYVEESAVASEQPTEPKAESDLSAENVTEANQTPVIQEKAVISDDQANRTSEIDSAPLHSSAANSKTNATETFLKNKFQSKKMMVSSNGGHGLIWTIIVILLIFWLIAFLFGGGWGLGYLLWLILVVALILLILRLLGIF